MRRFIEDAFKAHDKEEGCTIEEIESCIRHDHESDFDPKTDLTVQLRLALKRGLSKGRYVKQGRYYKIAPRIPKVPRPKKVRMTSVYSCKCFINRLLLNSGVKLGSSVQSVVVLLPDLSNVHCQLNKCEEALK